MQGTDGVAGRFGGLTGLFPSGGISALRRYSRLALRRAPRDPIPTCMTRGEEGIYG